MTDVRYVVEDYGPYDRQILTEATSMVGEELLHSRLVPSYRHQSTGQVFYRPDDLPDQPALTLDDRTLSVIRDVLKEFSSLSLDQLLTHIYNTPPMCLFEKGQTIDFGMWIPNANLDHITKTALNERLAELRESALAKMRSEYKDYELDSQQVEEDHTQVVSALMPRVADLAEEGEDSAANSVR